MGSIVKIWDISTGKLIKTLKSDSGGILSVSFSPDGKTIVSGSVDKTVKLWDVSTGKEIKTFKGHLESVERVSFSPDGKTIASVSRDNTVKLWDFSTGKEIKTFKGHSSFVKSISFSPDGKTIASGGDEIVKLWDVSTGKLIKTFRSPSGNVTSVSFSPDGKTIASASGFEVKVWDVSTGKEIKTFPGHSAQVNSISFSPDGKTIASASFDNTVKLWSVSTGELIKTFQGHSGIVFEVSFSPDGRIIASASGDNTVKLWDISTGELIKTFQGHSGVVTSISFSPDGKVIASASSDKTVKLWNVTTGKQITTFKGHSDQVLSIIFSSDGKTIASASRDKTVILWKFDLEDLLAQGCNWLEYYLPNNPETLEELKVCQNPESITAGAYSLVMQGQQLARAADLAGAIEKFQKAQQFDTNIDLNPQTKELDNNPKVLARKLVTKSLVEQGETLIQVKYDLEGGVEKFQKAQQFDPNIDLNPKTKELDNDPKAVASELFVNALLVKALLQGNVKETIAAYNKISKNDPNLEIPLGYWEILCLHGSFNNQAKDAMFACEKTVALAPKHGTFRSHRAIARTLTSDYKGAITDFEAALKLIDDSEANSKFKSRIKVRINDLRNGKNPYTPKVLEKMRQEFEKELDKMFLKESE